MLCSLMAPERHSLPVAHIKNISQSCEIYFFPSLLPRRGEKHGRARGSKASGFDGRGVLSQFLNPDENHRGKFH
jgi:hypothetical protein